MSIVDKDKRAPQKRPYDAAYFFAAAGMFFAFMGVYFGFVYMVLYGSTVLHLSNKAATDLLIFMLTANLPGRFIPAIISDKFIGPLNTIVPSAILSSAVLWVWAATETNRISLTIIACVYGFLSAGVQVCFDIYSLRGDCELTIDRCCTYQQSTPSAQSPPTKNQG